MTQNVNINPGGTVKWMVDATANDSDKTITVPTGKLWEVISIYGGIVCTATVGNRSLLVNVGNGAALIYQSISTGSITASQQGNLSMERYNGSVVDTNLRVGPGVTSPNVSLNHMLSVMYLPAGYTIRVWDRSAVDAAADDLTVVIQYIEYEA